MTIWKVCRHYYNNIPTYEAIPYNLLGHLICCWKWYGISGLKWCYLFKKQAEHKARKLNKEIKERF